MSDRAPDNQPTESIRTILKNVRAELEDWERTLDAAKNSVVRYRAIVDHRQQTVRRWERFLAIRLAEETVATQEVNGL